MAKENDMFVGGAEQEVVTCEVNNKPQPTKQEKRRKTFIKVAVGLAIVATLGMVAFALVGCNNNQLGQNNGNNPGISQGGGNNGGVVDPGISQGGNGKEDPTINPGGNGGQDDPVVDPVDPPAPVITEAEYKKNFEEDIIKLIRSDYNAGKTNAKTMIESLELKLINYETGDIYFTCERNNQKLMFIANNEEVAQWATYEALYENIPTEFEFSTYYTVQEDALAEEIAQFALTQSAIQTFAEENNLDLSSYTVINATEFESTTEGRESDIILVSDGNVLTFSIRGSTGYCSTQEDYLTKLKDLAEINKVEVHNVKLVKHYEMPVEEAESSASAESFEEEAESSASAESFEEEAESSASAEIIKAMKNPFPDYDISMGL